MLPDMPPRPVARTVARDDLDLIRALRGDVTGAWLRGDDGLVGLGVAVEAPLSGGLAEAADVWRELVGRYEVVDDVAVEGSGLVAFVSSAFAGSGGRLVVPQRVLGRRGGVSFETRIEAPGTTASDQERAAGDSLGMPAAPGCGDAPACTDGSAPASRGADVDLDRAVSYTAAPAGPGAVVVADGPVTAARWRERVAETSARIRAGEAAKVVLARAVVASTERPVDLRWLAGRLHDAYPDCWTYLVGDLVGATPEILVRLRDGVAVSRVLAGTVARDDDPAVDEALGRWLLGSAKDLDEHAYAVASVTGRLAPLGAPRTDGPRLLDLPNVRHLATDVTATVRGVGALDIAAALHPSAAVCGTPREAAAALIAELEGMDRGVYAGGVGWVDASGDGEIGIALRCGVRTAERELVAYAGAGIMADSDPDAELAETVAKLRPVLGALGHPQMTGTPVT